ncbi:MAG TPA: hypothetical protein CFH81_08985 [Sulfurovum sp. UBA12169]|nr:MAG TPA: hypothetical protein CFH81_08985 [Sulfurovum sp. UBA12169]
MVLKILKITDSKPGHVTVSDGVIEGIRKNYAVETIEMNVSLRIKFFSHILKFIFNNNWFFKKILLHDWTMTFFYKYNHRPNQQIHLIVSTGGDTAFMNIWLANMLNAKNIFCSSLRGIKPEHFSLIVSTLELHLKNSITLESAPTKIGTNNISKDVIQFCEEKSINKKQKYFVLLIGGDGAGYRYTKEDYENLVKNFMKLVLKNGAKGLITTSRRTGKKNDIFLYEQFSRHNDHIAHSVYFSKNPEKVVAVYLELASAIFVTEESGSMITESLFCKKPVFTLYPRRIREQKRYKLFLDDLRDKKRIVSFAIQDDLAAQNIQSFLFLYLEKTPIDDLAEKIRPFILKCF